MRNCVMLIQAAWRKYEQRKRTFNKQWAETLNYMLTTGNLRTRLARYNFGRYPASSVVGDQCILQIINNLEIDIELAEFFESATVAVLHYQRNGDRRKDKFDIENVNKVLTALQLRKINIRSHLQKRYSG